MSSEAVEVVLYDLGVKREAREAFRESAETFLSKYALDETEAALIRDFDIAGLQARKISPLLTIGFWMMNHPSRSRTAYVDRLLAGQA